MPPPKSRKSLTPRPEAETQAVDRRGGRLQGTLGLRGAGPTAAPAANAGSTRSSSNELLNSA